MSKDLKQSAQILLDNQYLFDYKLSPIIHFFINKKFDEILKKKCKEVKLLNLTDFITGNSINTQLKSTKYSNSNGKYPYISTKDLNYGLNEIEYKNGITIPENTKFRIAEKNSVLMCIEGGNALIKMGINTEEVCYGNKIMAFKPKDNYLPKYLLYFFMSYQFQEQTKLSGLIGGLSKGKLKNIIIPMPIDIGEQDSLVKEIDNFVKIQNSVEIKFDKLNNKIDVLKATIKRDFKLLRKNNKKLLLEIFETIFSKNFITNKDIPLLKKLIIENVFLDYGEYENIEIGKIFKIEYGHNLPAPKRTNSGEYNVYGSNGVVGTHNEPSVDSPCIIIGRKGSVGEVNISNESGCCVTDVAFYIKEIENIDLKYSYYLFLIAKMEGKGIKPGINRKTIYSSKTLFHRNKHDQRLLVQKIDELFEIVESISLNISIKDSLLKKLSK